MEMENTSAERIEELVEKQRAFYATGTTRDVRWRVGQLKAFKAGLEKWEKPICDALWQDLHKSYEEAFMTEIGLVYGEIGEAIRKTPKWAHRKRKPTPLTGMPSKSFIVREPLGCTLIVSPWNYPVQLLLNPLVGAISAGCTAILKPSPYVPNVSKALEAMIADTFPEEYVAVVQGNRLVNGELFKHRYDLLFLTGSPSLGRIAMEAQAKYLTPMVLELGGKSPCIVDREANLTLAARRIAWGKCLNSGQTCIAPDYLFLHEDIKDAFVEAFKKELNGLYPDGTENSDKYVHIVKSSALERITGYLKDGKVVAGGRYNLETLWMEPTLLDAVSPDSPVMQEEIFGPVFPILTFRDKAEVVDFVNSREKPLAFYYFGKEADAWDVIGRTTSGGACINDTIMHIANSNIPFGGVGNSGMGSYHSERSFLAFSHERAVVDTPTSVDVPFRYMPYKFFGLIKKLLVSLCLCLGLGFSAKAQVVIINDNLFQQRMGTVKAAVLDSLTNEPVSFASVYVIPSKDTTITNFTLTDDKGEAKLEEVPFGNYVFHVEMMGYKPYVKERYFRDRETDMGVIRLQVDEHYLEAAVVSDVGNPIVVKKDTVEFNASSFHVGTNAMLKDLLQRMPGMEITEDGKVKFNGEEIDKLTVGGRTFFFNDQSTALNNLPASVVDKIRVIDRESEATRASGVQDGSREKVLDVALKKEYEKGWFGNVGVKGGTTIGRKDGDEVLRDNRGFLWNANALVSAYSEKDQVTVIANGQNINDTNGVIIIFDEDGEENMSMGQGLPTAAQLGVNANTSRIKDVETTVSVNYKYTDTDSGTRADRTTYQDDGNLSSKAETSGKSYVNGLNANVEFKKETGNVWFHVRPSFRFNSSNALSSSTTETFQEGSALNSSSNTSRSLSSSRNASISTDLTFRELWGKKKRTATIGVDAIYTGNKGESTESSVLTTSAGENDWTLNYDSGGSTYWIMTSARYVEPIGDKWTVSVTGDFSWQRRDNVRDAFDALGKNDYYSSVSNSRSIAQGYNINAQYEIGEKSWITLGAQLSGILNETYSKSYGIEDVTGKDEWNWFVTPTFRFQHSKGNDRLRLYASGYAQRAGNSRMLPVLNVSNPSRLSLGNVYLKPYTTTYFNADWSRNNREKFSTLMIYMYGQLNYNPIVSALWYDPDGILYSVPVNARKPGLTTTLTANYTTPLDSKKLWSLTLSGSVWYSGSLSYQARTTLPALDRDTFNYSAFMADFWGNDGGDRFYGGQSGFSESSTRILSPTASFWVKYSQDRWSVSAGAGTSGRIARYSLNPQANLNTLDSRINARGSYTTKHEFEFSSDISYVFYNGYAAGYGQPEWQWNAEVSKNIGAFNLSITVHDILNQTRNLTHTVTANYTEDSYRLIMGRYILFGVKWNFGKMNASHSQRAQRAAWNMVF